MKHEIYSVFPHRSFNGVKFGVQMPKGILGFRTKKSAVEVAEKLKAAFTPAPEPQRYEVLVTKSDGFIVMCNTSDRRFWVPVSGKLPTQEAAQAIADKLNGEDVAKAALFGSKPVSGEGYRR